MTPEEARALLDGTTPGPWIPSKSGYIGSAAGVMIHDGHVLGDTDADTCLIAAAPTLAAMIANMREEWGVSCGGEKPGAWWASHKEADQCAKRMSMYNGYPRPIVVVRRYVTTEEEA